MVRFEINRGLEQGLTIVDDAVEIEVQVVWVEPSTLTGFSIEMNDTLTELGNLVLLYQL